MENKKKKKMNKKDFLTSVIIAVALALVLFLGFGQSVETKMQTKVDYNTFITELNSAEIKSASINKDSGKVVYKLSGSKKTYYTNYPYTDDFYETLLLKNVDVEITETNWLANAMRYGFSTIVLLLFFYLIFAKSMSEISVKVEKGIETDFKNIAGMDEIKEDLILLSKMMQDDKYINSNARIPKGVLLEGPPGNGKTLLARAFAGETGVNFIAINACDFGSKFVGVGSSKIKTVFEKAKENAPCVIFIDELDSVGAKRSAQNDAAGKEMNTMLTALLAQMDGFEKTDNVMVLAATNRVEDLDDALIRPGRFDRQFIIDYPDKKTRIELLELYTKGSNLDESVNINLIANKIYGYSCSKIECIVNEAKINAIKNPDGKITLKNFEDAIIQMDIKGHLKKNFDQDKNEKEIVAYHEAGHAIASYFLTDKKVSNISIIPTTSGAGGFTITEHDEKDSSLCPISDYKKEIMLLYGGRAAEVCLKGSVDEATNGAVQDIKEATSIAAQYAVLESGMDYSAFGKEGTKEVMEMTKNVLNNAWAETVKLVEKKWNFVDAVAKKLIDKETLNENEFKKLMTELDEVD